MRRQLFPRSWSNPLQTASVQSLKSRRRLPRLETLESRHMLSATVRPIDEVGNNLANPDWGTVGADLLRIASAAYGDSISTPAGADRQSARAISNTVVAQSGDIINNRDMSAFVYAWGQFLDHNIDREKASESDNGPPTEDQSCRKKGHACDR